MKAVEKEMYAFFLLVLCIFVWYVVKGVWTERVEDFVAVLTEGKSKL